ncbi:hypothetical protein HDU98_005707, partial [Podochytrium sp. JEL0797]
TQGRNGRRRRRDASPARAWLRRGTPASKLLGSSHGRRHGRSLCRRNAQAETHGKRRKR